jgi:hypothetical protein
MLLLHQRPITLERARGIEPRSFAWKATALPLSYARAESWWHDHHTFRCQPLSRRRPRPLGLTLLNGLHGRTLTCGLAGRNGALCTAELSGDGAAGRSRTRIAELRRPALLSIELRRLGGVSGCFPRLFGFADRPLDARASRQIGTGGRARSYNLSVQSRAHFQLCYSRIGQPAEFCPPTSRFQGAGSSSTSFRLFKWSIRQASILRPLGS